MPSSTPKPEPPPLSKSVTKKPVRCRHCGKKFANTSGLGTHLLHRHPGEARGTNNAAAPVLVPAAAKTYTLASAAKSSKARAKDNTYCFECKKKYSSRWNLQQHLDTIHSGVRFECPECLSTYAHRKSLLLHAANEHKLTIAPEDVRTVPVPVNKEDAPSTSTKAFRDEDASSDSAFGQGNKENKPSVKTSKPKEQPKTSTVRSVINKLQFTKLKRYKQLHNDAGDVADNSDNSGAPSKRSRLDGFITTAPRVASTSSSRTSSSTNNGSNAFPKRSRGLSASAASFPADYSPYQHHEQNAASNGNSAPDTTNVHALRQAAVELRTQRDKLLERGEWLRNQTKLVEFQTRQVELDLETVEYQLEVTERRRHQVSIKRSASSTSTSSLQQSVSQPLVLKSEAVDEDETPDHEDLQEEEQQQTVVFSEDDLIETVPNVEVVPNVEAAASEVESEIGIGMIYGGDGKGWRMPNKEEREDENDEEDLIVLD